LLSNILLCIILIGVILPSVILKRFYPILLAFGRICDEEKSLITLTQAHQELLGVIPNLFCQLGILFTYIAGHWLDWQWLAFASE
jgi:hypothetical protein